MKSPFFYLEKAGKFVLNQERKDARIIKRHVVYFSLFVIFTFYLITK